MRKTFAAMLALALVFAFAVARADALGAATMLGGFHDVLHNVVMWGARRCFGPVLSFVIRTTDVNTLNNATSQINGTTLLHCAAVFGIDESVRLLLASGVDMEKKEGSGKTALHMAAWHGNHEAVDSLLAAGADKDAKDDTGWTPLFLASMGDHCEVVHSLLISGADVSAKDEDGMTSLYWAAYRGHTDVVRLLLVAGARKDTKENKHGRTPLEFAALSDRNSREMALLLR
jgi:ankyrin repeat protein